MRKKKKEIPALKSLQPIQTKEHSATKRLTDLICAQSGLTLHAGNNGLITASIKHRARTLGIATQKGYLAYLESAAGSNTELAKLLDLLWSNLTMFFRDEEQLNFLKEQCLPPLSMNYPRITAWSAACSSGEEPYSLGMIFSDFCDRSAELDWQIYANDRSKVMISQARRGIYSAQNLSRVPTILRNRYFDALPDNGGFKVSRRIQERIQFSCGNVFEAPEFPDQFQIIVCRNLLIYCDWYDQQTLIKQLASHLAPDGYLLIGDCENLRGLSVPVRAIGPRVYSKSV